jgi:Pyruvate/2-oxoacid:ferredoxin oxidoreductase gamma subunit
MTPQDGDRELAAATFGYPESVATRLKGNLRFLEIAQAITQMGETSRMNHAARLIEYHIASHTRAAVERETAINRDVLHNNMVEINGYKEENRELRAKLTAAEARLASVAADRDKWMEAAEVRGRLLTAAEGTVAQLRQIEAENDVLIAEAKHGAELVNAELKALRAALDEATKRAHEHRLAFNWMVVEMVPDANDDDIEQLWREAHAARTP